MQIKASLFEKEGWGNTASRKETEDRSELCILPYLLGFGVYLQLRNLGPLGPEVGVVKGDVSPVPRRHKAGLWERGPWERERKREQTTCYQSASYFCYLTPDILPQQVNGTEHRRNTIGPLGFHHSRVTELASHVYVWLVEFRVFDY